MAIQTNKENTKIRVVAVYRMIMRGKVINTTQILNELKRTFGITANRKTIYSDIKAINRIVPVKQVAGRYGGYCLWDVLGEIECSEGGNDDV